MRSPAFALSISLTVLGLLSCGKGTPTAPAGAKINVVATPALIGVHGSSAITVTVTRSSGVAVNPGTTVTLSTSLGSLPATATTDANGVATAMLQGTGQAGVAHVTAASGGAGSATVDVTIGTKAAHLSLQATPTSVDTTVTTKVKLLAVVLDDQGNPLAGANVIFNTSAGSLASGGTVVHTNQLGEVTDVLTVTPADAAASNGTITVNVTAAGGGGTATGTVQIGVRTAPQANFTFTSSGLTVAFTDTSTGAPNTWSWDFGDGAVATTQSPSHSYAVAGSYNVTLRVSNAFGSSTATQTVTVQ